MKRRATLSLEPALLARLNTEAARDGRSRSDFVGRVLADALGDAADLGRAAWGRFESLKGLPGCASSGDAAMVVPHRGPAPRRGGAMSATPGGNNSESAAVTMAGTAPMRRPSCAPRAPAGASQSTQRKNPL